MRALTYPIIGLTGRASAGKDTVADFIRAYMCSRNKRAVKIACADGLKNICADVFCNGFGVPRTVFYGTQDEKEAPLEAIPGWTGRKILQYIGTEGFRHVHPEVWSRDMLYRARNRIEQDGVKLIVISDVRFISESETIRNAGGIVIRVKRPEADNKPAVHASETELACIEHDYVIDNQGRELYLLDGLVKDLLCQLNF